jgi:ectoine hydroxylase-related dioxygenase (phytanoyl-CoA dioxygenase family)
MLPKATFDLSLDAATKAGFDQVGFTTVPRITSDEEAVWFRTVYDRLLIDRLESRRRDGALRGAGPDTLWIRLNEWETMVFERTALARNARGAAARLLDAGIDEISVGIRFFFKPANGGRPVPWHQDEAHKDPAFDHRSVNVWVPLDAVSEANGCLWYLPTSHLGEVRVHRHPGHGAPEVALVTDDVKACDAVPVLLPGAGASFHHCRTVHASGPNRTAEHRRAIVLVCSAPARRRDRAAERPWLKPEHIEVPETSF